MMKNICMATGAALLIGIGVVGCSPQLAQTPLSPQEQQWETIIKENYPSCQAPPTVPPSLYDVEQQRYKSTVVPVVPETPPPATTGAQAAPAEFEEVPAGYMMEAVEIVEADVEPLDEPAVSTAAPATEPAAAAAVPATDTKFEIYTVQQSDSLSKIAQKFYGRQLWQKIADANQDVLKGSTVIKPGMKLKIPMP